MPAEPLAEAVVQIKGDKSNLTSAIEDVKQDVKKLDAPLDSLKAKLNSLKQQGGSRSSLGQLAKIAEGGGAVMAVSMIGAELDKATAKAVELSDQFRKGEVDAAGIAVGIGESLPVIGGFVSAGQNIRELFTHEKAEIKEINESIALGNQLMEMRVRVAEQVTGAIRAAQDKEQENNDKLQLLNTKGDKAKKAVEVQINYKSETHKLDEDLQKKLQERRKALGEQTQKIADSYTGSDEKKIANKHEMESSANRKAQADIKALEDEYKNLQGTIDARYKKELELAESVDEELQKLKTENQKKTAVFDNEKIAAYAEELKQAGYNAQQAAPLIAAFGDSLKADKYAEVKQTYADMIKQIQTLGATARETAINEAILKGANPAEVRQFADAYDYLQQKLKTANVGEMLKSMNEQVETFGTTAMERLMAKLNFNFATPEQRKQAIDLEIKIEGQDKAQKAADILKEMYDTAMQFGATPEDAIANKLNFLGATDQQKAYGQYIVGVQKAQEKAKELADDLKHVNEQFQDAGKDDITKQIDEMTRLAQESGNAAQMVGAIAEAKAKLEKIKADDFIRDQNAQANEVGKSEAEKAVQKLKDSGVSDPKLLADAWTAAAKKAGAELAHSLETPFQKYQEKMAELKKLFDSKAIDQKTFNLGKANAAKDYQSAMGGPKSIEQAFKDNLSRTFADFGLGLAQKKQKDADAAAKKAAEERKRNTQAIADNTQATQDLNKTLQNGITGTFA